MLRAAVWPWRSATTQCSTRIRCRYAVGPAGDVAGGEMPARWSRGIVDDDATIHGQARLLGERHRRPDADAGDDQIGVDALTVGKRRRRLRINVTVAQDGMHPMLFVDRTHHIADGAPMTRSMGRVSARRHAPPGPDCVTRQPTSSPMKLAPMTTHRFAVVARVINMLQSASVADYTHMR